MFRFLLLSSLFLSFNSVSSYAYDGDDTFEEVFVAEEGQDFYNFISCHGLDIFMQTSDASFGWLYGQWLRFPEIFIKVKNATVRKQLILAGMKMNSEGLFAMEGAVVGDDTLGEPFIINNRIHEYLPSTGHYAHLKLVRNDDDAQLTLKLNRSEILGVFDFKECGIN